MFKDNRLLTLSYQPYSSGKTHFIAEGYCLRDLFKSDGFLSFMQICDSFEMCKLIMSYKGSDGIEISLIVQTYVYGYPVQLPFYDICHKNS